MGEVLLRKMMMRLLDNEYGRLFRNGLLLVVLVSFVSSAKKFGSVVNMLTLNLIEIIVVDELPPHPYNKTHPHVAVEMLQDQLLHKIYNPTSEFNVFIINMLNWTCLLAFLIRLSSIFDFDVVTYLSLVGVLGPLVFSFGFIESLHMQFGGFKSTYFCISAAYILFGHLMYSFVLRALGDVRRLHCRSLKPHCKDEAADLAKQRSFDERRKKSYVWIRKINFDDESDWNKIFKNMYRITFETVCTRKA